MGLMDSNLDDLKYEMEEESRAGARIKVVGVGGAGCNAVARMVEEGVDGVEFYALNTDVQALDVCKVPNKLQLGPKITGGLGAGSNVDIGRQAAMENTDEIVEVLQGADMVFVTAGLGRRNGHRRSAGDRRSCQGTGCADGGRGHQAVRIRGAAAEAPR